MNCLKHILLVAICAQFVFISTASAQSTSVAFNATGNVPTTHTVVKGDTLYDLSGTYYGDVLMWPTLWSMNPQITNPHWIYPGDILRLKAGGAVPTKQPARQRMLVNWVLKREFVPLVAILADEDIQGYGEIVASKRDAAMLRKGDSVWIKGVENPEKAPKVGDYYLVYHRVDDEIPTEAYGDKIPYSVQGVVQFTELPQGEERPYIGANIVYSAKEIERGDLLIPYERQNLDIKIKPANKDLVGKIIYSVTPRTQLSEHNYVFIDQGSENGVQVGNRFFVYQDGDPYLVDRRRELPNVPMQRVGQLLVLNVEPTHSLAVVIDGKKEFEVGDRIEMYSGY